MHLTPDGDLFIPQAEWDTLVRIAQVEGHPVDAVLSMAAIEALIRNAGPLNFNVDRPLTDVGGVRLERVEPRPSPARRRARRPAPADRQRDGDES